MRRERSAQADYRLEDLTSGPGRLCEALAINGPDHYGATWRRRGYRILEGTLARRSARAVTPRIGIREAADWPLRPASSFSFRRCYHFSSIAGPKL